MTVLDWSGRQHWRGGWNAAWSYPAGQQGSAYHGRWVGTEDHRKPCRVCGQPTLLADDNGRPCHKTCAETELGP